ncbi:MAG: DUF3108 domain-containing protein [Betaproteobacteria bacterium]|nr:DUF3108 domain-containing protein [Betaproteobacteria bacterium]
MVSQHFSVLLLGLMLGTMVGRALAAEPSTRVVLEYRIAKAGITIGTVREMFSREAGQYRIVSETRTAGPVRLFLKDRLTITSEGRIDPAGLVPERYSFQRERDAHRNLIAVFDWAAQQIIASSGERRETFELPPGTHDRVSAMYQFMFRPPSGDVVSTWMTQGRKAEHYRYLRQGTASVAVAGRELQTVHYRRDAAPGESRAELWLAPDLKFLPVKMVFSDAQGLSLEQILVSVSLQ